tara:strand:- start:1045 stop:1590 length:546 start_codon:yes stop_codon:yes gene_type:complete
MASVVIAGNTSGSVTLDAPAVAGTTTLTLPTTSGTVLASGTAVTVAQGGTGLTSAGANGNVLTSDGTTWTSAAAPSSAPTTAQVLSATAGATAGAVGTYAMLGQNVASTTALTNGTSYAGSGFCHFGINNQQNGNSFTIGSANGAAFGFGSVTPSGTWLCLGSVTTTSSSYARGTLFLRVA